MKKTDGKWVTVNGAHIFIKNGQSLEDALKTRSASNDATSRLSGNQRPKGYRTGPNSYVFPVESDVKFMGRPFKFEKDIEVSGAITIFHPHELKEQTRVSQNYGGKFGQWSKKGGNSVVKISELPTNVQLHWYENIDGTIAGAKIVNKGRSK